MTQHSDVLDRVAAELRQKCLSGGVGCGICETQQATLRKYAAIARAVEEGRCLIVSPGVAKLPDFWRGITTNRDIERDARVWMEGYDAALVYCAEALHKAIAAAPQFQEEGK